MTTSTMIRAVDGIHEVVSSSGTRYRVQPDSYGFAVVCEDGSYGHTSGNSFDVDSWERRFQAFRRDPHWEYARERERELRALTADLTLDTTRQSEHVARTLQKGESQAEQ